VKVGVELIVGTGLPLHELEEEPKGHESRLAPQLNIIGSGKTPFGKRKGLYSAGEESDLVAIRNLVEGSFRMLREDREDLPHRMTVPRKPASVRMRSVRERSEPLYLS
jgi:hypothetical protein